MSLQWTVLALAGMVGVCFSAKAVVNNFTNDAAVTGLSSGDTAILWLNGSPGRTNPIICVSGVTYLGTNGFGFKWGAWRGGNNGINEPMSGDVTSVVIDNIHFEATNHGWGLGFTNSYNAIELLCEGSVEIRNCVFTNLMQHNNSQGDFDGSAGSAQAIVIGGTMTNVLVHNNRFDMLANAIILGSTAGFCTNVQAYSNTMNRVSWGIEVNVGVGSYVVGNQIWANRMDNFDAFDNPGGASTFFHQDGIYLNVQRGIVYMISAADGQGAVTNMVYGADGRTNFTTTAGRFYAFNPHGNTNNAAVYLGVNPVDPNAISAANPYAIQLATNTIYVNGQFRAQTNVCTLIGTPGAPVTSEINLVTGGTNYMPREYRNYIGPTTGTTMSGPLFNAADYSSGMVAPLLYNNAVVAGVGQGFKNGVFNLTDYSTFANNTCINSNASGGQLLIPNGEGITNINNLTVGFDYVVSFDDASHGVPGDHPLALARSDYNDYFRLLNWAANQDVNPNWPTLLTGLRSWWQYTYPTWEGNSGTNNPLIAPDGSIPTNSSAAGVGENLRRLGITDDFYGNARPGVGTNFDIGAFNSGVFVPGNPPSGSSSGVKLFWLIK